MFSKLGLLIYEIYTWNPYSTYKPNLNIFMDIWVFTVKLGNTR